MQQILGIRKTIKSLFSAVYMLQVVLTVPLSFEVGGNLCGLAFSFTLCLLYAALNSLRVLLVSHRRCRGLRFVFYVQHIIIPSLLIFFLSSFSSTHDFRSLYSLATGGNRSGGNSSSNSGILTTPSRLQRYLDTYVLVWNTVIKNLTALFIILEGISSLLLIQAIGKSFTWLIYRADNEGSKNPGSRHNEYKVLLNLLVSGTVLTIAFYFLYNIFTIPDLEINLFSSTLLGSIITYCLGLSLFGILSSKGALIESVLIFSYIVKCIYQTFPELTVSTNEQFNELITKTATNFTKEFESNIFSLRNYDFTKNFFASFYHMNFRQYFLSDKTLESISKMIEKTLNDTPFISNINHNSTVSLVVNNVKIASKLITLNLTNSFFSLFIFMVDAVKYLTILLVFNLAYRILVFYAATRIIPALKQSAKPGTAFNPVVAKEPASSPKRDIYSEDEEEDENEEQGEEQDDNDDEVDSEQKIRKLYAADSSPEPDSFSLSSDSTSVTGNKLAPAPIFRQRRLARQQVASPAEAAKYTRGPPKRAVGEVKKKTLDKARFIYSYAPCVIIAVYTNLMLLQRNEIDQNLIIWGWWIQNSEDWIVVNQIQFWNWLNMLLILGLYTLELLTESED